MINENAQKLVAALRSGKYQQTTGRLHLTKVAGDGTLGRKPGFCCLGVACELAIEAGVPVKRESSHSFGNDEDNYDGESSILPDSVQKWLGFRGARGEFVLPGGETPSTKYELLGIHIDNRNGTSSLTVLNDHDKFTFEDIAKVIESAPEGMFGEPVARMRFPNV